MGCQSQSDSVRNIGIKQLKRERKQVNFVGGIRFTSCLSRKGSASRHTCSRRARR
jgi:hypothetical protein